MDIQSKTGVLSSVRRGPTLSFVATGALGMLFWISKKYFQSDIENIEVALGFLHIIGLVLHMFRLADGRMAAV